MTHTTNLRSGLVLLTFLALQPLHVFAQDGGSPDVQSRAQSRYVPVHTYDPERNASTDIDSAIVEARKTGKRILVEVGGDWCPWCRSLEQFFKEHPDLLRVRETQFVTVDVYYGTDKKNEQVLSHYSKVLGIPHCFVLDSTGMVLHSQHMIELQAGGNYSREKIKDFLIKWSSPAPNPATPTATDLR